MKSADDKKLGKIAHVQNVKSKNDLHRIEHRAKFKNTRFHRNKYKVLYLSGFQVYDYQGLDKGQFL